MLDIVFEDQDIILLNKPIGILSYGENSLETLLRAYLNINPYIINRLDKDTSGLIMFAKNPRTADYFSEIFATHQKVEKTYLSLVSGVINEDGRVDAPIRKNYQQKKMVIAPISSGAKEAITLYHPLKCFGDTTLIEIKLLTGRTHQIRVHMSFLRHHVVGDYKYGDFKINNLYKNEFGLSSQFLHSYKLKFSDLNSHFAYLNGKVFEAKLPEKFEDIIKKKN